MKSNKIEYTKIYYKERSRIQEILFFLEREKQQFVFPLIYAFTGCLLYVSLPEIKPTTLAYWVDASTN